MKTITILTLATFLCLAASATRINLNTYQWSDRGYYINGNTFPYHPGDTIVLSGSWNYCSMDHVRGTAARHVVFINQGALNMTSAPSSATDTGVTGELRVTSGFIYVCIATNTWVRAALSTW